MEKICDRVAIIHRGRLVIEDQMQRLLDSLVPNRRIRIELESVTSEMVHRVEQLPYVKQVQLAQNVLEIDVVPGPQRRSELSRFLIGAGLVPVRIEEESPSLEDAFVAITSETIEQVKAEAGNT